MHDPNLFAVNNERLFEVLLSIVALSFIVERALAPIFESKLLNAFLSKNGLKEFVAIALSGYVCKTASLDAIAIIFSTDRMTNFGFVMTGLVVAGGSKASIKLFHDVFDAMSNAERERQEGSAQPPAPPPSQSPPAAPPPATPAEGAK